MNPIRITGPAPEHFLLKRLTIASGLLAAGISLAGIFAARSGIVLVGGEIPGNKTIALSAALIWIILGSVLAIQAVKPPGRIAGLAVQAVLILIALFGTLVLVSNILGGHFFIENFFVGAGLAVLGPSSSPISPAAAGLAVTAALALVFVIRITGISAGTRTRDAVGVLGLAISLVSITFVLGYAYGNPLLYGTEVLPIAFISALAAFFTGASLIAAAGPGAMPVRYLIGNSTHARLLRVFIPLVAIIILSENLIFVGLSSWFNVRDAILFSITLVVFIFATALVVARVSGRIGRALNEAEQELVRKNEDLGNLNEELTASDEELRQSIEELTRAEKALRESEERFRSVLDNSPDVLYRFNLLKRQYEYFSPACLTVYGYSPEEMIAMDERKTWDHVHPDDRRRFEDEMAGIHAAGDGETEIRWKTRSGDYTWLSVSIHLAPGTDGLPSYRYGFVRDITKRRVAEQALAETLKENTFLADLLNRSEQPFGVGYPDGRLGIVNPAFERLTGYSAHELRTMDWATVLTPSEWRESEQKSLEELHHRGLPVRYEKEYIRKDGSRVPIELLVHLVKDLSGNPLHYYSFITDITQRKRAEVMLRENEDRLRFALETSHTGAWDLDLVDHTAFRSEEHDRIFGYSGLLPQWTYEMFLDHVLAEDREMVDVKFRHAIETKGDWSFESRIRRADGEVGWIWAAGRHRAGASGSLTRMAGVVQDITEQIKAREELKRKNDNLNALNEELTATEEELHQNLEELSLREEDLSKALAEKEVLLSEIHHRVKNNLTAFISLLSLEGSTEETPGWKMLKQDLQNRARSMALVHETLYRTHLYNDVDMEMYLSTLLDQIKNSFRTTRAVQTVIDAHGVMLDIPRATPAGLIINELVTNTFKYAFPESFDPETACSGPPAIRITLTKIEGLFTLTVRDNGIGLPPGFDPATTRTLGLKLVNFLAKYQLRAEIEVSADCGTEFVFRFRE